MGNRSQASRWAALRQTRAPAKTALSQSHAVEFRFGRHRKKTVWWFDVGACLPVRQAQGSEPVEEQAILPRSNPLIACNTNGSKKMDFRSPGVRG